MPFKVLAIDFIIKLAPDAEGNNTLLTVIDKFLKAILLILG
jgi:hypothetical protein